MGFLYSQLFKRLPYPEGSFAGKTVVVTGSNIGLGKEAARHYARLGASNIILAVRNLEKGQAAKEDIESTTGIATDVIQVWHVDMGSYASVEKFAARVSSDLDRVDIFHANAGLARTKFNMVQKDEEMITVNVVCTILLFALVLPKLKESAAKYKIRPIFSITSSVVHEHTTLPQKTAAEGQLLATISDKAFAEKHWDEQYPISKLLEVFFVRQFADEHPAPTFPITLNCINPGLCHSELGRDVPGWGFIVIKAILARSTEVGSRTLVHAGSAGIDTHGQYLSDCQIGQPGPFVLSAEGKKAQGRVYKEILEKLEGIISGVTGSFSA
ncbi:putative short-chain dehydrogenase [Stachybotrys elegans]|uniref:Short-chain dehydrogenase n=1 Tax=Stachybotrys elegans TaxID=80388 RepID=A0A8K0SCT4_9HYPO|nr:putative short-chain dehydrogenase [Stachybotrys elegans]